MDTKTKFFSFIGHLVFVVIFSLIAGTVGNLQTVYCVLFSIGIFFLAIAATLMADHGGTGRVIVFFIGFAFLIIPAFVQIISVISSQSGTVIEISFFAICVAIGFIEWLSCGHFDGNWSGFILSTYIASFIIMIIIWPLKSMIRNDSTTSIVILVVGIIALIIMGILRIVWGSALED
ncbi:MAG: hypothetical protein J1G07_01930 [Clostridiales bacterium]|nr:hypothetical protein [Clostridiales bacterium]